MRKLISLITLYCLLAFFTLTPALAQDDTSPSAIQQVREAVRQKVQERLTNLSQKPQALVGTLVTITDTTLDIKTKAEDLKMASTNQDTVYLRVARRGNADISFSDLAIGDFTVAMGYFDKNGVLQTSRVVTYEKNPLPSSKRALFGVVEETSSRTIKTVHPKTKEPWEIQVNSKTEVTKQGSESETLKVADIETGNTIIVTGIFEEGIMTATKILILE